MTNDPADPTSIGDPHARYADWDAAYVLGALSAADRAEFERHLRACRSCTAAVTELAGLPGLLGKVDPADVEALLTPEPADLPEPGPPADLLARITRADDRARSKRIRRRLTILVAAAVLAAAAVIVPISLSGGEHPTASAVLTKTSDNPLTADVQLFSEQWGTRLTVTCGYATDGSWQYKQPAGAWTYGLYLIDSAGRPTMVSSWIAHRGDIVHATGSTNLDVSAIDAVQIRSIDTGKVLLSADLG
ncbi:zf-HC2 domain-containing protein [Nakamurella lactea]|uniref:zf-HC2 domain-containing protein n=1 Tax=Nakamurella lactea TaxID=459515 RepID=UPI000422CC92|nr:zf-HC2 domain-containing protein [Nakamurella lactea]